MHRTNGTNRRPFAANTSGSVLIGLIVITVILGAIGALLVSLTSTSVFSNLNSYSSTRSLYLAQSGYDYFGSQYKNAVSSAKDKNEVLENLNGKTYKLAGNDGSFTFKMMPYHLMSRDTVVNLNSASTFIIKFPGEAPYSLPDTGTVAVFSDGAFNLIGYSTLNSNGNEHSLSNLSSTDFPLEVNQGDSVFTVISPAESKVVNRNDNLAVSDPNHLLPRRFGMFVVQNDLNNIYKYETRVGDTLQNITVLTNPAQTFTFSVSSGTPSIILHSFARVESTGLFAEGSSIESRHTFARMVPLGFTAGGNSGYAGDDEEYVDDGTDPWTDTWEQQGPTGGGWDAKIKNGNEDGDQAIVVKPSHSSKLLRSTSALITLKWRDNPDIPDLEEVLTANSTLSYEVQTKIKVVDDVHNGDAYMLGISFRLDATETWDIENMYSAIESGYGVSFFKSDLSIPRPLLSYPLWMTWLDGFNALDDDSVYLVLWKKSGIGNIELIASQKLTNALYPHIIDSNEKLRDWSTIILKVDEQTEGSPPAKNNHISVYIQGESDYERGVVSWDQESLPEKYAVFENVEDASFTSPDDASELQEEIGLHAFYDEHADEKLFFDDVAIKVNSSGSDSGSGIPGI